MKVMFKTRAEGNFNVQVEEGETIKHVLVREKIPFNSVIVKNHGKPIIEDHILRKDDEISIEMVENYLLNKMRLLEPEVVQTVAEPIHCKTYLLCEHGEISKLTAQFDREDFVKYIEDTFVESIMDNKLLSDNNNVVFGLSGGKDSLAMLLLFHRTRSRLPRFRLIPSIIKDWGCGDVEYMYAENLCRKFDIELRSITKDYLQKVFNVKRSLDAILSSLYRSKRYNVYVIDVWHEVMRRGLEYIAAREGATKIAFGANLEDTLTGLIRTLTGGVLYVPPPTKSFGNLTYITPLYRISKKEIRLYLDITVGKYTKESPPSKEADIGSLDRSFFYAFTDYVRDLWPGIEWRLYEAANRFYEHFKGNIKFVKCKNCGLTFLNQYQETEELCLPCLIFKEKGELVTSL